jgi:hypothetical protein
MNGSKRHEAKLFYTNIDFLIRLQHSNSMEATFRRTQKPVQRHDSYVSLAVVQATERSSSLSSHLGHR